MAGHRCLAVPAPQRLHDSTGDPGAALRIARQPYRDATAELLHAARNEDVRLSFQ